MMHAMYAGYSLLHRRGLLKVDDFTSPRISFAAARNWTERIFLVQLSKSPDVLEATANVLLEVDAPLDVISWFKGIYMNVLRCSPNTYIQKFAHRYAHTHMHGHVHSAQIHIHFVYLYILKFCQFKTSCICSVIIMHAVIASLLKEGLTAKHVFHYSPVKSFKKILFAQLNNKPWTAVNRCAGILVQHGKAEYAEALISRCLGNCVYSPACTQCNVTTLLSCRQ